MNAVGRYFSTLFDAVGDIDRSEGQAVVAGFALFFSAIALLVVGIIVVSVAWSVNGWLGLGLLVGGLWWLGTRAWRFSTAKGVKR